MRAYFFFHRSLAILIAFLIAMPVVSTSVYGQKKNSKEKSKIENKEEEGQSYKKPEFKVYYVDPEKPGTYELDYEIKARFTKYSKEKDFKKAKKDLKDKFNIEFDYKNLKFNKDDELIAAEISVKTQDGNSGTYVAKEGEPVEPFGFIIRGEEFRIGKIFQDMDEEGIIKLNDNIEIRPFGRPFFKRYRSKYEADNILLQDTLEKLSRTLKNLGEKLEKIEIRVDKNSNRNSIQKENTSEDISNFYFNGKEVDKETMKELLKKIDSKVVKLITITKQPEGGKGLEIVIEDDNSL